MTTLRTNAALAAAMLLAAMLGCSSYSESGGSSDVREPVRNDSGAAVCYFKEADSSMQRFFDTAYGYAIFPEVAKGAAGIGAAHGDGVVYEQGRLVGYTELSQATVGAQLGGQTYREIIFFQDAYSLDKFKRGNVEFSAQASAVAAAEGASADADYAEGVAIFTLPIGGLMGEASIGGQKFSYEPAR